MSMDPRLAGRPPRHPSATFDGQQMQSAKVTLLSALLKPEPQATRLVPNIINEFHPLLIAVAKDDHSNSPEFVKCVARMVTYIAPSRKRTVAIGHHLMKLVNSFHEISESDGVRAALNYLHMLAAVFVCSLKGPDHVTPQQSIPAAIFTSGISAQVVSLIELAALPHGFEAAPIHKQIHALQLQWQRKHIFTKALRMKMRAASRAAYDDWLSWMQSDNRTQYERIRHLSLGNHSHTLPIEDRSDDSWYNAPVSAMIPHIRGQTHIRTSALDTSVSPPVPLDPELETVLAQHISEVAKVFAGPNIARFASEDHVALNGLGQPVSLNASNGKRRRLGPVYYGNTEKCAKSFKRAREELPAPIQIPDPVSHNSHSSRNVPPPMETQPYGFSGSQYPTGPSRDGPAAPYGAARDGMPGGNTWRGGGNSWTGDRGRGGYGGRGGGAGAGARGRGRGVWNNRS